jgi:hypothetical protein
LSKSYSDRRKRIVASSLNSFVRKTMKSVRSASRPVSNPATDPTCSKPWKYSRIIDKSAPMDVLTSRWNQAASGISSSSALSLATIYV